MPLRRRPATVGVEEDREALARRHHAYIASVDSQTRLVSIASRLTMASGLIVAIGCIWILLDKLGGG